MKIRKKMSAILIWSKDQLPENSRCWRRTIASSDVFPEPRHVVELILRPTQDDGIFDKQVPCAKIPPSSTTMEKGTAARDSGGYRRSATATGENP
jgi:hypothetical protein